MILPLGGFLYSSVWQCLWSSVSVSCSIPLISPGILDKTSENSLPILSLSCSCSYLLSHLQWISPAISLLSLLTLCVSEYPMPCWDMWSACWYSSWFVWYQNVLRSLWNVSTCIFLIVLTLAGLFFPLHPHPVTCYRASCHSSRNLSLSLAGQPRITLCQVSCPLPAQIWWSPACRPGLVKGFQSHCVLLSRSSPAPLE